jgi:uncharacterized FlgJ-related protein
MFAVVIGNRFHRFASNNALVMNIDDDVAKKAWLENLNRPFGWEIKEEVIDLKMSEKVEEIQEDTEEEKNAMENGDGAKKAWFAMLNEEIRHREEEEVAKRAWLLRLQKPVVHSEEELAKQTWFAKFKKAAS